MTESEHGTTERGTVNLAITRMAHGGEGIGNDADGRVVFVAGALPGTPSPRA
ncbi:TRAM domain-containing protein [Corynebacterium aquatimens]|uniref:TRAM domain-containing protein n=1 Tax=Corynebacterium aquatimens TaxID=1190508 RepID=UPI0033135B7C